MYAALILTILLAHQSAIGRYLHKLSDSRFSSVYHVKGFDLALIIPYFAVLVVLAMYGLHRYWLVYDYFTYSKNVPPPPPPVTNWPRVTVQLPIFNERYVIERLTEAVARFDYPRERLDVQVLDDSTRESPRLQGGGPGEWTKNRQGRIRGDFRRRLHSATGFSSANDSLFLESRRRRTRRYGADTLDVPEQQLFPAD